MMLQQVMTAPGEIEFQEVPVPEPEENQVLVYQLSGHSGTRSIGGD